MRRMDIGVCVVWVLAATMSAHGDTVYLKNGAYIDGMVKARTAQTIDIEIGKIGKLEIPVSDVDAVEKNGRTGDGHVIDRQGRPADPRVAALIKEKEAGAADKKSAADAKDGTPAKDSKTEPDADTKAEEAGADEEEAEEEEPEKPKEPDIAPALKAKILQHVEDLKRQKAQFRTRAERHLRAIGAPALPYLYPITTHELEVTRIAAMRLISDLGDETSIETCLDRLLDPSEFVRDLANRTLERVTQESFGFQASANPRRREMAYAKWRKWWEAEKAELSATEKLKKDSSK